MTINPVIYQELLLNFCSFDSLSTLRIISHEVLISHQQMVFNGWSFQCWLLGYASLGRWLLSLVQDDDDSLRWPSCTWLRLLIEFHLLEKFLFKYFILPDCCHDFQESSDQPLLGSSQVTLELELLFWSCVYGSHQAHVYWLDYNLHDTFTNRLWVMDKLIIFLQSHLIFHEFTFRKQSWFSFRFNRTVFWIVFANRGKLSVF